MHDAQIRVAIAGAGSRDGTPVNSGCIADGRRGAGRGAGARRVKPGGQRRRRAGGRRQSGIAVQSSLAAVKDDFDVLIDFTRPEGTLNHLAFCREHGKGMVIGTTGFDDAGKQAIRDAAQDIPILAANFSVGVNVLLKLLEKAAKVMGDYTDIEIIEAHHPA